jgi:gramicidin S synthase 2/tyrocidine synthetase-3
MAIPAVEKMDYYSLSPAQGRLYFLQHLKQGNTSYNEYSALELNGAVDKNKFAETFNKLIARHESFRTYFVRVGDEVRQRIAPVVHFQMDYEEVEGEGLENIINRFIRPFDLEKPPLLRVKLIRFQAGRYWLIYDMHHIITDGTSMAVLWKEFAALYAGESLELLRIQYKDFSQWQNSLEGKEVLQKQESYWLQEFQAEIPVLQLYTDYPRPELQRFEGDRLRLVLSEEDTQILKTCALKYDVTLFMLLLGIYNMLLSHLTGQEDIVTGTPIAARRHADLQCIIGMFVNTLALRNYPVGDKRFIDFLAEIKTRTLEVFENQEYPFEELVEKVIIQRSMGRNPLFDTIFAVQNMESQVQGIPEARISDIQLQSPEFSRKISKFDLSLHVLESGNVLTFIIEYSTALFKKESIERFYRHFIGLALNAAAAPLKKIHDLDIISDEEKEKVLYQFNDTAVDCPREKTIHQLFAEQAAQTPDYIALHGCMIAWMDGDIELHGCMDAWMHDCMDGEVASNVSLTYRQLNEQSDCLAGLLTEKGVLPDDIVAIKMPRSSEMVIATLATLKAGCAYLPIDPDYPQERIDYMLKDSNARILLTGDEKRKTNNCQCSIVNCQLSTRSTGLAYIVYTSGSTGKPKGVMIEHRSVVRLVINNNFIDFSGKLRVLQTGAPVFDAVTFEMWGPLLNGGQLYLVDNEVILDPSKLGNALQKYQVNTMWLTASLCNQLVIRDSSIFSALKWLVVGGDVLSPAHINEIRHKYYHLTVVNGYGPTENTTFSVCHRIDRDYEHNIPIGKPIANSTAYIFNKYGRLQPVGVPGELYVGGDGLARGYLNNPDLTREKFIYFHHSSFIIHHSNLYKTGDLARWLPNGLIEFLGRVDNQVKIRGFRVELGEIENRLLGHKEIKEAIVTISKGEDKLLCAYITGTRELTAAELREYLALELPGYMIPSYFVQMDKLPLTVNGKINREALPAPQLKSAETYTAPGDEIEAQIIEIWSRVLDVKKEIIGIHDDFFHLGGHSLKATLLTLQIAKLFNVKFTLTDVFTGPTVKEMANVVRDGRKNYYEEIKPIEKKEYYLQSSPQKRLFFLEQFENIGTAYNITSFLKITGKLDIQKFRQAVKKVIQRHETLRTSFRIIANEPVQVIHKQVEFEVENYTLPPGIAPDDCIRNFVRPFDLSRAPLVRVGLITLPLPLPSLPTSGTGESEIGSENYLLMYDLHHIIGDGTSMGILIDDFAAFYNDRQLPPLHVQYKDFTAWQNQMIASGEFKKQEEYWLKVFENEIPKLNFPTDYPRPENLSFNGDRYSFKLIGEESESIYLMAVENKATLFMVMLAAFNALLYKYSGQKDIIVGTGIMGRHHDDLQRSIGMFVNSLAIRNYPAGEKTFRLFLSEVRENCIGAFANQDIQFEELVDKLKLQRDNSRNPLFDVLLVVQNFEQAKLVDFRESELADLKISPYYHENKTAKFDLNLAVFESGKDIYFRLEYCADLFRPETITEIAVNYLGVLKQIIKKWDILLDDLVIANDLLEVKPGISQLDKSEFTF